MLELLVFLGVWCLVGPLLAGMFSQSDFLAPKFQGQKFMGIKRTNITCWLFYIIGGPGFCLMVWYFISKDGE